MSHVHRLIVRTRAAYLLMGMDFCFCAFVHTRNIKLTGMDTRLSLFYVNSTKKKKPKQTRTTHMTTAMNVARVSAIL